MIEQQIKIGEVIEASTVGFTTQCYRLYESPKLGSLIQTQGELQIFGIVIDVSTNSIDPGRRPIAIGETENTEEDVYNNNPQLTQLLRTEVRTLAVGSKIDNNIHYGLPSSPPKIHSFVYNCSPKQISEFTSHMDFLSLLLNNNLLSIDEVTIAFLKYASEVNDSPRDFLVSSGKELASLLSGQIQRLDNMLKRLSP